MQSESTTRLERLKLLRAHGLDPYPSSVRRTHTIVDALKSFDAHPPLSPPSQGGDGGVMTVVGRVRAIRLHGKTAFIDIEDGTDKIQLYLTQETTHTPPRLAGHPSQEGITHPRPSDDPSQEGIPLPRRGGSEAAGVGSNAGRESDFMQLMVTLDVADFIEATGTTFLTKMGEPTLRISSLRIIAKSLEPLPEKWHGLQDVEQRFRKRYLDLIVNEESRAIAHLRMRLTRALRTFFDQHGFLEVETPILQPIAGGASARPFVTHHHALDVDFFLRVAPELYLKRLIIGGFEKVYEIGRCFRNEGIDREHNPEFTMLEFYWAYADYEDLMKLTEELFVYLLNEVKGAVRLTIEGKEINCAPPYPRLSFEEALEKRAGIKDAFSLNTHELSAVAREKGITVETGWGRGRLFDELWKHCVRPTVIAPTFLIDHPIELSPLAKRKTDRPELVERFQLIMNGYEVVNAFSELNDPIDQEARFRDQEKAREAGDQEAQRYDEDFVTALRHGMPPTAGWGMGIDRLASLFAGVHNLKEVILFPTLRPRPHGENPPRPTATPPEEGTLTKSPLERGVPTASGQGVFPRDKALKLLRAHVKNKNLIKHMLAVEAVMRALAEKFGGNPEQWGLAGLLHDIDWEETENDFTQHSLKSAQYLAEAGVDPAVVQAIKVHNHVHGFPLSTMLEKALFSAEELTGLIVACALVQPSKKLSEVTVESILKKFKQPSFAKGVNREVILQSENLLGMTLTDLAALELKAMQEIAEQLGL